MPAHQPTRLLLVDDNDVLRASLRMGLGLEPDLQIVGEAADGAEAIELCQELQPDVVLMDLKMPGMSGFSAISAICSACPSVQIIVLSSAVDQGTAAITAGAARYLTKDVSIADLAAAIHAVYPQTDGSPVND